MCSSAWCRIVGTAVSALTLSALASAGLPEAALMAAPLVLLASALLGGCYPGEQVVAWMVLRAGRTPRSQRFAPAARPARARAPRGDGLHGGLLIACRRCGRAPPGLVAGS